MASASELPCPNTVKFLHHRCLLEAILLSSGVPQATFHIETLFTWTSHVKDIDDLVLRRCYSILLIKFLTNLKSMKIEFDIPRILENFINPYCRIKIEEEDLDEMKELVLESILENNVQSDFVCVAYFYDAYLTAFDPTELD